VRTGAPVYKPDGVQHWGQYFHDYKTWPSKEKARARFFEDEEVAPSEYVSKLYF